MLSQAIQFYDDDQQFSNLVDGLVDQLHEPKSYEWVNEKATIDFESFTGQPLSKVDDQSPIYQVFVDYQMHYLRLILTAALARMS